MNEMQILIQSNETNNWIQMNKVIISWNLERTELFLKTFAVMPVVTGPGQTHNFFP